MLLYKYVIYHSGDVLEKLEIRPLKYSQYISIELLIVRGTKEEFTLLFKWRLCDVILQIQILFTLVWGNTKEQTQTS